MAWNNITDTELASGKPITTSLMTRIRDNIIAIGKSEASAPRNVIPKIETHTSGSGTWVVPAGVYRAAFFVRSAGGSPYNWQTSHRGDITHYSNSGGSGAAGCLFADVTPGDRLQWNATGEARFGALRATKGADATRQAAGANGVLSGETGTNASMMTTLAVPAVEVWY